MENSVFIIISTLLGGLAVFIFGMNLMSEGLQKAAGDKMRKILAMLTKNPVMGVIAGALVTVEQCYNSDGNRICKCWTHEVATGYKCNFGGKYRYNNNGSTHSF